MPDRVHPLPGSEWSRDTEVICCGTNSLFRAYFDNQVLYRAETVSAVRRLRIVTQGVRFQLDAWGFIVWATRLDPDILYQVPLLEDDEFELLLDLPATPHTYVREGTGRILATVRGGGVDPPVQVPYEAGDAINVLVDIDDPKLFPGESLVLSWTPDVTRDHSNPLWKLDNGFGVNNGVALYREAVGVYTQVEIERGVEK